MSRPKPLRLALIGWGAIGSYVASLLVDEAVEIVAVAKRDHTVGVDVLPPGVTLIQNPDELAATKPHVVAEAAGKDAVGPWGHAALQAGADFIVSSVSALADSELLASLRATAVDTGARVIIQPGALAGVEALAAARLMGVDQVEHRIIKPPRAWAGTPAEDSHVLADLADTTVLFSANAADTALAFPKNANVAMTTALAGIGPMDTRVTLIADPHATTNRHELRAHGPFGTLDVTIANSPLPTNPKTSALAALSLVRCINNRVSPIVI